MDRQWWDTYGEEVTRVFTGEKFSCNPIDKRHNVTRLPMEKFSGFGNSGAGAVSLAAVGMADRIIMVGFDCQFTDGVSHWHGDHPPHLSNCRKIGDWPKKFDELARFVRPYRVINASRVSALTQFPRMSLEDALAET